MSDGTDDATRVVASGAGYRFAVWREVYILEWTTTVSLASLDDTIKGKRIALTANPGGIVVLNLLAPAPMPSREVRARAEEVQDADLDGVLCHATVVEEEGFRGGAMRSALAGLYLVSRTPYPRKVFSTVREAAAWCAPYVKGPTPWAVDLVAAVRAMRAEGAR